MASVFSTGRLARACACRARLVVGLWLLGLVLTIAAAGTVGGELTDDDEFVGSPESVRGAALLEERMPGDQADSELVIVRSEELRVDDPAFRQTVQEITADLRAVGTLVREAPTYYDAVAAGDARADVLVSPDRHTTLIPVTLQDDDEAFVERIRALAARTPGYEVLTVGDVSFDVEESRLLEEDLVKAELYGLPAALVVLVIVFGALLVAGVPIALALASILGAVAVTVLLARVTEMSVYALNMISMIGLAVGIDYALFVVDRYREERRQGRDKLEAIAVAGGTASKAVLFSGATVMLGLLGMFMLPNTLFRSLGAGAILVVAVAVLATLTLVPAMLSLLADRLYWPRRRRYTITASATRDHGTVHKGFWGAVSRAVMTRSVVSVVLVGTLLVAAALPYLDLERGTASVESLPPGDVRRAYELLAENFPAGLNDPVAIVVDAERGPAVEAAIDRLVVGLATDGAFGPVTDRRWNDAATMALVEVPLHGERNSPAAYEAVERLRDELIPAAFADARAEALVTGDVAYDHDFNRLVDDRTPWVFAFVLGLSFLLLLLAFRSVVVPIKAIAMNLLSVGAAYGLLVLVFQKGYGADLLGFQQTPTIEAWVPIFLFCVLFGLSMDYHVFLLSRIKEHFDQTGHNAESVAVGLQATARLITGAALIMIVVFAGFAMGELVMFQQMGFGLAVAIFLDATVVRSVLVPASMALLGDRNWYLPRWLSWLPDFRVEGPAVTGSRAATPVGAD